MTEMQMWAEAVLGRLRADWRNAVNTLVAAGISEDDARHAASQALRELAEELRVKP